MSAEPRNAFDPRVIGALIAAGIIGFVGYWLLSAFAPDLVSGRDGGTHALSRSATGFSGLYTIARDAGLNVEVLRRTGGQGGFDRPIGLLVLTPPLDADPEKVAAAIDGYRGRVLLVLPKHVTSADPLRPGWVHSNGRIGDPGGVVPQTAWRMDLSIRESGAAQGQRATLSLPDGRRIALAMPAALQSIGGSGIAPTATLGDATVMATPAALADIAILSDPDLLNNSALADPARATAALRILQAAAPPGSRIAFDVTLNGLGVGGRSLLRLVVTPPFVGLTLCLLAAALLALWQGFVRFGPAWREERAVARGKAALVASTALLISQARRVAGFAPRYAALVRDAAAHRLHAPAGLAGDALDRWLDRFPDSQGRRFSQLARALETAQGEQQMVAGAQALGRWRKEILRDG